MPRKHKKTTKRRQRNLKGGFVAFEEGPIDGFTHALKPKDAPYHLSDMQERRGRLQEQLQTLEGKYNQEAQRLQQAKGEYHAAQKEERDRQFQRELTEMGISQQEAEKATESAKTLWAKFIAFLQWILQCLLKLWRLLGDFLKGTSGAVYGFFHNNTTGKVVLFLLSILFVIIIIVLLGFLIAGIVQSGKEETPASDQAAADEKNGKCSRTVQTAVQLDSITQFGESLHKNLNDALKTSLQFVKDKQAEYAKMTTLSDFSKMVGDPIGGLREMMNYCSDSAANNDYLRAGYLYCAYMYYAALTYMQGLLGNAAATKFNQTDARETITGRNDGINNINSTIFQKPLMRKKGIDTSKNAVVNISTPENITWTLSDTEYEGLDVSKVPPTLLEMPDKKNNNVSIADKKEVIIPWITKDKYYVLSCENAYFKNNPSEKANLLIDNYENNTCTYDLSSRVETFGTSKTRHRYTNDLSQFL